MSERVVTKLPKLNVGDEVLLLAADAHTRHAAQPYVVTQVGRKWGRAVHRDYPHGPGVRFDLATGNEYAGEYTARSRVATPEVLAEESERVRLTAIIGRELLNESRAWVRPDVPTAVLRSIAGLLSPPDNERSGTT